MPRRSTAPAPFDSAAQFARERGLLPTGLTAAELERLAPEVRARAVFSARVADARILQALRSGISRLVRGVAPGPGDYTDPATLRLGLKQLLQQIDYQPDRPEDEGTIKDLRTDRRLNLILETQEKFAAGYGQFLQATDPDVLDDWPAWELVRIEDRNEPRDWKTRWAAAAVETGDEAAALSLRRHGRMAARKDSPIWAALSRFGQPQPPFDYGSGMGVEDVPRDEALALGLIAEDTRLARPDHPRFDRQATADVSDLDADLRAALLSAMPSGFALDAEGVLRAEP